MPAERGTRTLLANLMLAGLPSLAAAQHVGSEFQVNTYTTAGQQTSRRAVAADASGNFVVVWNVFRGTTGQRYDSTGNPIGTEFRVNLASVQDWSTVAAADDGDFVVVWEASGDVFGRRFESSGDALGEEFRVNTTTAFSQEIPSVSSDAGGNFVVVWQCSTLYSRCGSFGQRYDSEGEPQGGEFRVGPGDSIGWPTVASAADGHFVVAWTGDTGTQAQRYDSEGTPLGGPIQVIPAGDRPFVASDRDGNFVVAAEDFDGSGLGIFARRFDSEGGALGPAFRVNSHTPSEQELPSVASDASGNFVVTWTSDGQDGSERGVFGRWLDTGGEALASEFQINTFTTDDQSYASAAAIGADRFVVVWNSFGQDGSGLGVFGQRFDFDGETITVVSPNANLRWPVGSVQRIKWTHSLGPAATFRIELDRGDDGDYEELIADAVPVDSATKGSFAWTVTGPPSGKARVRVSWTADPGVTDASDVTFQIRPL